MFFRPEKYELLRVANKKQLLNSECKMAEHVQELSELWRTRTILGQHCKKSELE